MPSRLHWACGSEQKGEKEEEFVTKTQALRHRLLCSRQGGDGQHSQYFAFSQAPGPFLLQNVWRQN